MQTPIVAELGGEVLEIERVSAKPSSPISGKCRLYFRGGGLCIVDSAGVEVRLADFVSGIADTLGYVFGCVARYVSPNQITIGTAGEKSTARSDADDFDLQFTGTLTLDLSTSGAGGLDAGSEAPSTWYAVYLIGDSSGANPIALLASASFSAPTLPTGYDRKRRVFSIRNNGAGNIRPFRQVLINGSRFLAWDEERGEVQALGGGSATVYTTISLAPFMPPSAGRAELLAIFDSLTSSSFVEIRPADSAVNNPTGFIRVGIAAPVGVTSRVVVDTSPDNEIQYRQSVAGNSLDLFVIGYWEDLR